MDVPVDLTRMSK